jgi:hypothetical protein
MLALAGFCFWLKPGLCSDSSEPYPQARSASLTYWPFWVLQVTAAGADNAGGWVKIRDDYAADPDPESEPTTLALAGFQAF